MVSPAREKNNLSFSPGGLGGQYSKKLLEVLGGWGEKCGTKPILSKCFYGSGLCCG
jgi:hypothetical protein